MKSFFVIFRKELIDTLRDRRTIIAMVVIPLLLFPVIIGITVKVTSSIAEKAQEKKLRVAVVNYGGQTFLDLVESREDFQVIENVSEDSVRPLIQRDSLDGAFVFSPNFDGQVENLRAGRIKFYYKSSGDENRIKRRRLTDVVDEFEKQLLAHRFTRLNLKEEMVKAVNLVEVDIATQKERFGQAIGGFLPYIFVIFCFVGAMYPAIDLGAGEKERGTLETLLTAPVNRFQILLGKFGVVVLAGISAALLTIVGLYVGIRQAADLPAEFEEFIVGILEVNSILLLLSLLLPLSIFFAGVLLSLSIFARTFKEAQSIISPFNIVVILPAAIGLIPGIELDPITALIPILNVSLATKEIISGTIEFALLLEVYVSLTVLALLSLFASSKLFLRESVIFRG